MSYVLSKSKSILEEDTEQSSVLAQKMYENGTIKALPFGLDEIDTILETPKN